MISEISFPLTGIDGWVGVEGLVQCHHRCYLWLCRFLQSGQGVSASSTQLEDTGLVVRGCGLCQCLSLSVLGLIYCVYGVSAPTLAHTDIISSYSMFLSLGILGLMYFVCHVSMQTSLPTADISNSNRNIVQSGQENYTTYSGSLFWILCYVRASLESGLCLLASANDIISVFCGMAMH